MLKLVGKTSFQKAIDKVEKEGFEVKPKPFYNGITEKEYSEGWFYLKLRSRKKVL